MPFGSMSLEIRRFANCYLCSASWALNSEGFLACHTYCDTGHPFIMVISKDPLPSRDWINPMYTARCNIYMYSVFVFKTQRKAKLAEFQTFNSGNYRQVMCYEKFYKKNVSHRTNTGVL